MSLKIKVSKKVKNQCESTRTIKSQVEIMDETKRSILCEVSHCSIEKEIHCFWDRHKITGLVIRCPLRYKPKQIVKVYKSDVSQEEYTIKENVVKFQNDIGNFKTITDNLEVTDAFCSFNCCLAWIRDNKHDRRYDESEMLLQKIYSKSQHGLSDTALKPSPHWRTLTVYGGTLSLEEFRKNTFKTKFFYNGPILDTGYLFSKKISVC
ncbi:putative protein 350L [Cricket iridovirus]|uniref:Uncharacterized protein n=2 Tax=Iridoviridae TaxID=10486 RepID=A0A5B8RHR8_9VIRU|nr:putative protein 350L [Iridovirus Liz-CrIV]UIB20707.1 putative protein 350L [Cricket iridovirus]